MTLHPERGGGFTLIEMMIVLAILSLAVALVLPYLSRSMPTATLGAATQEVRAALAAARSEAITEDREVRFDGGLGVFRIDGLPHELAPATPLSVELRGRSSISFYPSGASSGGRIVVRTGAQHREIEVEALTGHAILLP